MAYAHTHTEHSNPVQGAFAAARHSVATAFSDLARTNAKVRMSEAVMSLSDAELEARGLKRQDIARHLFVEPF